MARQFPRRVGLWMSGIHHEPMPTNPEPKLAAPGAGLPLPELMIGRMFFRLKRLISNRAGIAARFEAERAIIRGMVDQCPTALRGKRILIARCRGLEDSSRNWSVWMTLDHLRITNNAFSHVIRSLVSGQVPTKPASTADVKPDPTVTAAVDAAYEQSCAALMETIADCPDLNTKLKYSHPWFGPMNAAAWHVLSAGHLAIHREQIRRILTGL